MTNREEHSQFFPILRTAIIIIEPGQFGRVSLERPGF
jgi:hypothetical protein